MAFNLDRSRRDHLQTAATATKEADELVLVQYNIGLTDFNNVLVTQENLFALQDQLVAAQAQIVVDLIALYKALGGGWNLDQPVDPDASANSIHR